MSTKTKVPVARAVSVWEGQQGSPPRGGKAELVLSDRELRLPRKSVEAGAQGDRLFCLPGVQGQEAQGD